MAPAPIQFDRASGALEGANLWERTAALALATGSKISSHFSHMGYIACANLLRKTLPERNIAIRLNSDAVFEFPYGDGYWSKLLNRSYSYEDELEVLFRDSVDVDYTFGHQLEDVSRKAIEASGGKVLGGVRVPLNTMDMSSYLLAARASGAKVIVLDPVDSGAAAAMPG